ncbi:MAG: hypothetical protein ABW328_02705 [Ilumatobacteraceae bacterium]
MLIPIVATVTAFVAGAAVAGVPTHVAHDIAPEDIADVPQAPAVDGPVVTADAAP